MIIPPKNSAFRDKEHFENGYLDLPCSNCGEKIPDDHISWFWMLHSGPLRMHLKCFRDLWKKGWFQDSLALKVYSNDALKAFLDD